MRSASMRNHPALSPPTGKKYGRIMAKSLVLYQIVTKSALFKPRGRSYFSTRERRLFAGANASDEISGLSAAVNEMSRYDRRFPLWDLSRQGAGASRRSGCGSPPAALVPRGPRLGQ